MKSIVVPGVREDARHRGAGRQFGTGRQEHQGEPDEVSKLDSACTRRMPTMSPAGRR